MKKLLLTLIAPLALVACGNPGQEAATADDVYPAPATVSTAPATPATEECLLGTWTMEEGGITKSFRFDRGNTGEEVQSATDVRPFSWQLEDEQTVRIIYTAHGDTQSSEWDLDLDCQNQVLSFYGARYMRTADPPR